MCRDFPGRIKASISLTAQGPPDFLPSHGLNVGSGRLGEEDLAPVLYENASYYLCGPPLMVEDMNSLLIRLGVPNERIAFERWW